MTMTLMLPVKIAQLKGGSPLIKRIAARACQMQGMPEIHYEGVMTAEAKQSFERGVYNVLAALESLGFELLAPPELSPTLPHDREEGLG